MMPERLKRRDFLKRSAMATMAAGVSFSRGAGFAQSPAPSVSPNDKIMVGFIGTGRMGQSNLRTFLKQPEVEVAAVCDVYGPNLDGALKITEGRAKSLKDFRQILDMREINAVVVSSPDHWHALQTILACQAGKDVYVEKPVSVYLEEGRRMVQAARKYQRVVQVGTQQRSGIHFQKAVELIRQGHIGKISLVRTWNYGNSFPEGIGNPPDSHPPADLDWDLWLGPAPKVPFNANRFGVHPDRWSSFRWFWSYAGGMVTDWGVHLLDIVQWVMNVDAPASIVAQGGKFYLQDNRETPDTLQVTYEYPGFVCVYENRECNANRPDDHGYGICFHGTLGTLFIDRGGFEAIPEKTSKGLNQCEPLSMKNSNHHNLDHVRNFLDCVKNRQVPICDIEIGHRSSSVAQLGNIAYRTKSHLVWDAKAERFSGNKKADQLLRARYRKPWKLTV
jgi:predicted dehydrogenase